MVLDALGVHLEEAQVRHLTDCSPLGTDAFQLIEAARQLGFTTSRKYTLTSRRGVIVKSCVRKAHAASCATRSPSLKAMPCMTSGR
jgi:Peptidase C39 family